MILLKEVVRTLEQGLVDAFDGTEVLVVVVFL